MKYYFNSVEEASRFIFENKLKSYHFESPIEYEDGIDLVIDEFVCDICKQKTHTMYEGSEPNTCCDCMPFYTGHCIPLGENDMEGFYDL